MKSLSASVAAALTLVAATAAAAPVKYTIDSGHTYPGFTADHFGGLSTWRGKFNSTSGTIVVDKEAGSGTLDVSVDAASINFGNDKLNDHAKTDEFFDVKKYPKLTYTGKLTGFKNGAPTEVDGTLTMRGVSKPLKLKITSFKCILHPMKKKEVCGADAVGTLNRDEFGISYGKQLGFKQEVGLEIQVEATKES